MKKLKSFLCNPQTILGLIILAIMLTLSILAPVICPGNPLFSVGRPPAGSRRRISHGNRLSGP